MTRNRSLTKAIAATASVALVLGPTVAWASDEPLTPLDSTNSIGQSLQVRTNADGVQNAELINYRWAATQITVSGDPGSTVTVKVPENGKALHNLEKFGFIHQENGMGVYNIPIADNGVGVGRSVSLFPQEQTLPMELKVEFTLDGQPITAEELRGKSGQVTAKYTLINKTTKDTEVTIDSVTGDEVTKTVQADVPWVAEASTLLPFRFAGLNAGHGAMLGADGRGNWLIKWIKLPFRPIAADGSASFGWSANVENVQIPKLLIQASPVYIAPHDPEQTPEEAAAEASDKAGVPPPNVDSDVAMVQEGLAQVIDGLEQLTSGGGGDPLTALEESANAFFEEFGTEIQNISTLLDPDNPDGVTAQLAELVTVLNTAKGTLDTIESSGKLDQLEDLSDGLTQEMVDFIEANAEMLNTIADGVADLPPAVITAACSQAPDPQKCTDAFAFLQGDQFQGLADALVKLQPVIGQIDDGLEALASQLPDAINTLQGVIGTVLPLLTALQGSLTNLSDNMATIAAGLADKNVDLPTLDAVVAQVIADIKSSPGGQDLSAGMALVQQGIGGVKSEVSAWAAAMVVAIQAAAGEAKAALEEGASAAEAAVDKVDSLVASVNGLKTAAATSPLPYGGFPEDAPPGTKLAGAYEFRIDAADAEHPSTLPRILIALVLFIGGGFLLRSLASRHAATVAVGVPLWSTASIAGAHQFSHDETAVTPAAPATPTDETSVLGATEPPPAEVPPVDAGDAGPPDDTSALPPVEGDRPPNG